MDRNSIIGLLLIGAILIGFSLYNQPSKEEAAASARKQDSIAAIEKSKAEKTSQQTKTVSAAKSDTGVVVMSDSALQVQNASVYGAFASAAQGEKKIVTLENELMKVRISNKGARIIDVTLKKYTTYGGDPLVLFNEDSSRFALNFLAQNKLINTDSLVFSTDASVSQTVSNSDSATVSLKANAGNNKYLEFVYTIKGNSYMMSSKINFVGLNDVIAANANELNLNWMVNMPAHEKSLSNERNASTIYYKQNGEDVDYLTETKDASEKFQNNLKWVSFKEQFFTSVIVADDVFGKTADISITSNPGSTKYVKTAVATLTIPYKHLPSETFGMGLYFGPNHFKTLKAQGNSLERQVPLGWGIFGWVNRFIVIPVFNFLDSFNWNYGIVILILTLVIKTLLFPLTYKSYQSTAKMRVLKPEIDVINEKFKDDAMKKQQETMSLYRQAGVNPLGGCLPMLLQIPILIALFRFFPASIELRQKSFLWAEDLSTYDSVYNFGFEIPFYGDHVSLFTILMTISTILYTRMNNQLTGDNPQMAQMKWMMYLMPVIFLGVMNNYAAGLSYYYFLANMITFGQQWAMRKFVDEDAIHAKIQETKSKPTTKSKFQQRLEEMTKQRAAIAQQPKKK